MGLVHREHRDLGAAQRLKDFRLGEALRRDIDQLEVAPRDTVRNIAVLIEVVGRVEARGRHTIALQLRDLVAHQRDQGRDHQGEAIAQQGRELIAQRLAAAGGHDGEHVLAREDRLDDVGLAGAERLETEGLVKQALGSGEVAHVAHRKL
jgi:hypothetical protein